MESSLILAYVILLGASYFNHYIMTVAVKSAAHSATVLHSQERVWPVPDPLKVPPPHTGILINYPWTVSRPWFLQWKTTKFPKKVPDPRVQFLQ